MGPNYAIWAFLLLVAGLGTLFIVGAGLGVWLFMRKKRAKRGFEVLPPGGVGRQ